MENKENNSEQTELLSSEYKEVLEKLDVYKIHGDVKLLIIKYKKKIENESSKQYDTVFFEKYCSIRMEIRKLSEELNDKIIEISRRYNELVNKYSTDNHEKFYLNHIYPYDYFFKVGMGSLEIKFEYFVSRALCDCYEELGISEGPDHD